MNVPRQLFDQVNSVAEVESLSACQIESLYLDFKDLSEVRRRDAKREHQKMRELLGKAVSGFANAQGGLLVFGVKEAKNGDTVIRTIEQIPGVMEFEQRVAEQISRVASFAVDGCETKAVEGEDGAGLVLVYIPPGQARPHRSQVDHKYYRRSGESFVPMEHYEVADMFTSVKAPRLVPAVTISAEYAIEDGAGTFELEVRVSNESEVLAEWVRIVLVIRKHEMPAHPGPVVLERGGTSADVIYPGDSMHCSRGLYAEAFLFGSAYRHRLEATLEVAAKGVQTQRYRVTLENEDQLEDAKPSGRGGELVLTHFAKSAAGGE